MSICCNKYLDHSIYYTGTPANRVIHTNTNIGKASSIFCKTKEEASFTNNTRLLPGGAGALCPQSDDGCAKAVVLFKKGYKHTTSSKLLRFKNQELLLSESTTVEQKYVAEAEFTAPVFSVSKASWMIGYWIHSSRRGTT
jgi:hypothetical protein